MAGWRKLRKIINASHDVRCVSGPGLIREEVWKDEDGNVARYNLAFINHYLTQHDNGRVLGYDSSHGHHHRHFKGSVEAIAFTDYESLANRFFDEVDLLRKEKA